MALPSAPEIRAKPSHRIWERLPQPVQHLVVTLLKRARDPEPEAYSPRTVPFSWGWLPLLTVISALGLFFVAFAFANARYGGTGLRLFLYPGLLLIFTPTAIRLISPTAARAERIVLLCVAGISLYIIKVMSSPLYFSFYDEFLHWRTAEDIARNGHLFTENSLLPVSPYYPGLEIVTNALSTLGGLDTFHAGLIVLGVARLLMIIVLSALYELICKSDRVASIAVLLYMANSHFMLFDAQYAYESLALPLATLVLFALAPYQSLSARISHLKPMISRMMLANKPYQGLSSNLRMVTLSTWIILIAAGLTHHVTIFFFDGLLVVWAMIAGLLRLAPVHRSHLAWTALLAVLLTVLWIGFRGNPVVHYVSSFLADSLNELKRILLGTGAARQLFVSYNGLQTPLFERVLTALSIALVTLCLPFGLLCLWQRYRSHALAGAFGIVSLLYPVSQIFRLTNSGAELADRSAAFLFIPLAFLLALFITQFWAIRQLNWQNTSCIVCALTIVFLGGLILGSGPSLAILPGPYEVGADQRSVEPEGIQVAMWAASHLGPDNRVGTDRTNQVLMGTYGDQHVVTTIGDRIDVSPVFFAPQLGANAVSILRDGQIHYLVVDMRLAQSLPLLGIYFVDTEPDAYAHTTPIPLVALTKFNAVPQINKVFDSGNIVIYDVGGLIHAPKEP